MTNGLKYDPSRKWIIEVTEQQLYDRIADVWRSIGNVLS